MSPSDLRLSGALQAGIIALTLGSVLRQTPSAAPASAWPYLLAVYGLLAALSPWLAGVILEHEFSPRYSLVTAALFALPMVLGGSWLLPTPYRAIGLGAFGLAAIWCIHLLVVLVRQLRAKRAK